MSRFYVNNQIPRNITFNNSAVKTVYYNKSLVWELDADSIGAVLFKSPKYFIINFPASGDRGYDGTLEYSTDYGATWEEVDKTVVGGAEAKKVFGEYILLLRGSNNTRLTGSDRLQGFSFTSYASNSSAYNISCSGNIEYLLDYQTVQAGGHPTMAEYCFYELFKDCDTLIEAPRLSATTLAPYCYSGMFSGCDGLTETPQLPATTLAMGCYKYMFSGCEGLTNEVPTLPATTLASECYQGMFSDCINLTKTPTLRATTLADYCYANMFEFCVGLTEVTSLPALTLASNCYQQMFNMFGAYAGECQLTTAPALPATQLEPFCYSSMFGGWTKLTSAPKLSANTMAPYCYQAMFVGSGLKTPPALPATTLADACYYQMFAFCYDLAKIPALPATTLPDLCYYCMFEDTGITYDITETTTHKYAYRIPTYGTTTSVSPSALEDMFGSGWPGVENTTFYVNVPVVQ